MDETPRIGFARMQPHRKQNQRPLRSATICTLIVAALLSVSVLFGQQPPQPAAPPADKQSGDKKKIDPVEVNGPIFVDWPKPDVALVFTGEQDGYLEPCGCAGLENQKGGLKRRFTFLKQLREKGWNVVAMDLGGQEVRTGVQALRKVDFTYSALMKMGYAVVGYGPGELKLGTDLTQIVINLNEATNPLISANVSLSNFTGGSKELYKIVDVGGMRIGITTVLGKKEIAGRKMIGDFALLDPNQAIPRFRAELRDKKCDHLILLANAEPKETKDLAQRFPE